ncbi:MAG TPA: sterol desaturase family protein, partial [Cytophagaceae bacterium]|nr:sterol desaturase family protein [Cytophagaceae bacterium]
NNTMKKFFSDYVTYGLYPTLLTITLLITILSINQGWDYKIVYAATTVFLVLTLVSTETVLPLSKDWSMTKKSFWRDLKYISVDAPTIAIAKIGFGWLAIYYSEHHTGFFSHSPILLSTIAFLLVFEFFQYWYHRLSHTSKGKLGKFLWRVHLAHHLPDKVYVMMHAVFNPVNAFITATIIQIPLILLGISPEAVLAATLLIDLQSLISHFNVNVKAGWLNYIFIGTETHRYHHSANKNEAQNYGNTLAIWDIIFGTFYYRPNEVPEKLGVGNPQAYPTSENLLEVISLPFKK